jgi:hypothetical protein
MLTARNGRRFASPDQRTSSRTLVHPPMPQGSLMPTRKPGPAANRLLTGLPRHDLRQVLANCDKVDLVLGDLLYEPGKRMRHVYFPIGGFISLITPVDGHASLEVGLIGNEGMLGIPLMLGVNVSSLDALVQGGGAGAAKDCRAVSPRTEPWPGTATGLEPLPLRPDEPARAIRRVHAFPCSGGAPGPLAVDDSGPGSRGRVPYHSRVLGQHAGGASRGRHQSSGFIAEPQAHQLSPRRHQNPRP